MRAHEHEHDGPVAPRPKTARPHAPGAAAAARAAVAGRPGAVTAGGLLALQRAAGNRAVAGVVRRWQQPRGGAPANPEPAAPGGRDKDRAGQPTAAQAPAMTVQRYMARDATELNAVLATITTGLPNPRLKNLIKLALDSLPGPPSTARADLQTNITAAGSLGEVKTLLRDVPSTAGAHAFWPPAAAAAPAGQPQQPWKAPGKDADKQKLKDAVTEAKAKIRAAAGDDTELGVVFSGVEKEAKTKMTEAADKLNLGKIWQQQQQSAPGMTGPKAMNLLPGIITTLVGDHTAWDNGQHVLQHETFHLVAGVVDAFYRPDSNDADVWRRFLNKPDDKKLTSAPHFEEVVAATQDQSLRPDTASNAPPTMNLEKALEAATTLMHWGWTAAANAADFIARVATPGGLAPPGKHFGKDELSLGWAKLVLFISLVEGLNFHDRLAAKYQQKNAASKLPVSKESVLRTMRPDPLDRERSRYLASWLNPMYGHLMGRKYSAGVPPTFPTTGTVAEMTKAFMMLELAAASPFRDTSAEDLDLVLDLQAGIRKQGPNYPAVKVGGKAQTFLSTLT
jgi:hypothetical protein